MIKWKDVKLGVSPLTRSIYIGKTKIDAKNPEFETWTDKSEDKTTDVLKVVLDWFIIRKKYDDKDTISVNWNGKKYSLTLFIEDLEVQK